MKKVIVIGLDGLEPKIAESLMDSGNLPNLDRLRQQGGYTRLKTTYPPQTPVAWSTFTTGTNPGGHGIFDFLTRDPRTYLPALSLNRYEQKNIFSPPKAVNLRHGEPFWVLLSKEGIGSTILRCPCTYPPDEIQGRMLAGVGVPDLRGGLGTSTFYTSKGNVTAQESEKVIVIQADAKGTVNTHLVGPRNPKTGEDIVAKVTLAVESESTRVMLYSDGQPESLAVNLGEWSGWLKVKFKVGLLQSMRGIVRFYLSQIEPHLELYASPINFDPSAPLFPITHPVDYASELERRLGTYYTLGMAEDHDGLIHERFDEIAFVDQCNQILHEREKMMLLELDRFEEGFFFCLFDTPDRLQHMMWRAREPEHPANKEGIPPEMKDVIEEHYRDCDAIVGKALQHADDDTLFVVLSDHGMNSFQRGLNLNTWLYEQGWLALDEGFIPGNETGDFFHHVDWSQTKAYALGLGGIFINLRGREAKGIVDVNEAETVKAAIAKGLTGLLDPDRGKTVVTRVLSREQIYSGPYVDQAPDLLVNFAEGYRVSWGTPLGGTPAGLFEDNIRKWGGDHMLDPDLVPGVLFMNQAFREDGASLVDLAPTIMETLGLAKGPAMEGSSLIS